jgi:hypothetical protein
MKVLTIGNSFSGNALRYMNEIVAADGTVNMCYGRADLGGCSLEKLCNLIEQCELLPNVKPYDFAYNGEKDSTPMTLKEILVKDKWDYVTIQQVSSLSWVKDSYEPYFTKLYNIVKELAPQAEIVVHQTWAYRKDGESLKDFGITQQQMFERLEENYSEMAGKHSCRIIPSGEALQKAREILNYKADKSFNFKNPSPIELPDQSKSLNAGYHWKTGNTWDGKASFADDCRHANKNGCYLIGALWFEFFTGKSILGNTFVPDGVSFADVKLFQKIAHDLIHN